MPRKRVSNVAPAASPHMVSANGADGAAPIHAPTGTEVDSKPSLTPPPGISPEVAEAVVQQASDKVLSKRRRLNKVEKEEAGLAAAPEAISAPALGPSRRSSRRTAVVAPSPPQAQAPVDQGVSPKLEHNLDSQPLIEEPSVVTQPIVTVTPKKRARKPKREPSSSPLTDEEGNKDDGEEFTPSKTKAKKTRSPKKPTPKKSKLVELGIVEEPIQYDEDGNEIVKKKKKVKVYPKIEYDIPPVERLSTTFRGETHCSPCYFLPSPVSTALEGWNRESNEDRPPRLRMPQHCPAKYETRFHLLLSHLSDSKYQGGRDGASQRPGNTQCSGSTKDDRGEFLLATSECQSARIKAEERFPLFTVERAEPDPLHASVV